VEPPAMLLNDEDWNILVNQYEERLYPTRESVENNLMSPDTNYAVDMYLDIQAWVKERVEAYNVV
jgi:hypothetical protein